MKETSNASLSIIIIYFFKNLALLLKVLHIFPSPAFKKIIIFINKLEGQSSPNLLCSPAGGIHRIRNPRSFYLWTESGSFHSERPWMTHGHCRPRATMSLAVVLFPSQLWRRIFHYKPRALLCSSCVQI